MASNPMISKPNGGRQPRQPHQQPNNRSNAPTCLMDDLTSTLECPICLEYLSKPIYMCAIGHNICGRCNSQLTTRRCPLCAGIITTQRNFALESVMEKVGTKCKNSLYGCTYSGSNQKVEFHEMSCLLRQYDCPYKMYNRCNWKGLYTDLVLHFQKLHPRNTGLKVETEIKFYNFDPYKQDEDLQLIELGEGLLFVYHVKIDPTSKTAKWAIQKIENIKTNDSFDYEFIYYHDRKYMKMIFECLPSTEPILEIFKSGNCVGVPLELLKNFVNAKKELAFRFNIKLRQVQPAQNPRTFMRHRSKSKTRLLK